MASSLSCALAIGGLDPGGGAGIAADLRAFAAGGVFGCAAVAVLTVQSTAGLRSARAVPAREVTAQVEEVMAHQRVRAVKVGALGSGANVRAIVRLMVQHADIPFVVDTPIRPTLGHARLLAREAVATLRKELLPHATIVTLNTAEVEALLGTRVRTVQDARQAAVRLAREGPRAVVVKGGHMTGRDATDVVAIGGDVVEIHARRLAATPIHGTGCTFAALIAGRLARSSSAPDDRRAIIAALRWAKRIHHAALERAVEVGDGLRVLTF
jgi:hydroxymethylpyrimidine/phosphomethylpyrimidine kinase